MNQILQIRTDEGAHSCRLCGGQTTSRFTETVLRKYPVRYSECGDCGSMQTDMPYWLDEAYAVVHSATDTGMAARTLHMAQVTSLLLRLSSVRQQIPCLDWGGGNGLYCRLMRDQGYNFFNHDKYAEPFYCAGFTADRANTESYDVVTSFEVFEHLAEPRQELGAILALKPKLWIFSTQLYEKQERDWSYFGPSQGRHVFFYSERALHDFAAERGYTFVRGRHLHMFVDNAENPYLRSRHAARAVRNLLHGHRLPSLAAMVNFLLVQRHAYLRWQSDSELMKSSVRPDIALRGGP